MLLRLLLLLRLRVFAAALRVAGTKNLEALVVVRVWNRIAGAGAVAVDVVV